MIKLYKQSDSGLMYWEAWSDDNIVTIHYGRVGTRGQTEDRKLSKRKDPHKIIEQLAATQRRKGYAEISLEDHRTIIIQHKMIDGTSKSLQRRHLIEEGINEVAGWIGVGNVDGGDIGMGVTNIFIFVIDPKEAINAFVDWLNESHHLTDSIIAIEPTDESEPIEVIWPPDFSGSFTY